MEIFSIEIQKYMYGVDYKMKIISNILKSTPIEISDKIKYEKNLKLHIMVVSFICERKLYLSIIEALDNLDEYEMK
jgi:hypothetical protein